MFANLLRLCTGTTERTPLEDFTTEVLCGVLSSDEELTDGFVNEVLRVSGAGFSAKSQVRYPPVPGESHSSIVDLVIRNADTVVFVENKVYSSENEGQLEKYAQVLKAYENGYATKLRYCTKYMDLKNPEDYPSLPADRFRQFRWCDVYDFLSSHGKGNALVDAFLSFLKEQHMSRPTEFTYEHLIALREIGGALKSMDECFENIKADFTEIFGKPYEYGGATALKEIPAYNRYSIYNRDMLDGGDKGYAEVFVSFDLGQFSQHPPALVVHLYVNSEHAKLNEITARANNPQGSYLDNARVDSDHKNGLLVYFEKPLSDFVADSKQRESITKWFRDHMQKLRTFLVDSGLPWKIPGVNSD